MLAISYRRIKEIRKLKQFYICLRVNLSSQVIRKRFLDYFINENEHTFIPSSPVAPWNDKSVAFVNAGMNQVSIEL